jgi:hypothetical protein
MGQRLSVGFEGVSMNVHGPTPVRSVSADCAGKD